MTSHNQICTALPRPTSELEKALMKLASGLVPDQSKASIARALKDRGLPAGPKTITSVQALSQFFCVARKERVLNRARRLTGNAALNLPAIPTFKLSNPLPAGHPRERLDALRRNAVEKHAKELFRHGAPGGTEFKVSFTENSEGVCYRVALGRNFDVYRGKYKGWAANVDVHCITVPTDWRLRVERCGFAKIFGGLTLGVKPLATSENVTLYTAIYALQGRGYSVNVKEGFIAVCGKEVQHSSTPEGALNLLKRF